MTGTVTGLDRPSRTVSLEDGSQIPYDILAIASGMQDAGLDELGLPEGERPPIVTYEELCASLDVEVGRELAIGSNPALPVAVIGHGPESLTAVEMLQACGVPADYIAHYVSDAGAAFLAHRAQGESAGLFGRLQRRVAPEGCEWRVTGVAGEGGGWVGGCVGVRGVVSE